jgi:hypothetical protein
MKELPTVLQIELVQHRYGKLIAKVPFFASLNERAVVDLCQQMKSFTVTPVGLLAAAAAAAATAAAAAAAAAAASAAGAEAARLTHRRRLCTTPPLTHRTNLTAPHAHSVHARRATRS